MSHLRLRTISTLFIVFIIGLALIVTAGIGGVALVDITRAYVGGEALYSKAQKGAVLSLYRYARTRDPAEFQAYLRLIQVPIGDRRAREALEDPALAISASYGPFRDGGNHADDVAGMAWLFRNLGQTALFAPAIEIWRQADSKVTELAGTAHDLRDVLRAQPEDEARVSRILDRLDAIDDDLTTLEASFSAYMGHAARHVTGLIYAGLGGLGLGLALLARAASARTDRRIRAAERTIAEREARFRDVAELAVDWIWETDAELRFTYLSDRLETVSGLPKSAFLGKRRWELNAKPGPDGWAPHMATVRAREPFHDYEYTVADGAGLYRIFRVSGKPIQDEEGRFLGYRGTGTDVTEQVMARQEAALKQELLKATFENLGQGVSVVDQTLTVVAFNHRFLELLDFPADRFAIGDPFEAFIRYNAERGEYGEVDVEEAVAAAVADARNFEPHAFERVRPDGTVLAVHGLPLPSGGFVTTYRDVTEERRAQQALEISERRTREVIDRALDAFMSIDAQGVIVDWNPAAETTFGWGRDEAIGRHLADLIMPERYKAAHRGALARFLETGQTSIIGRRAELAALHRNGHEFPIELTVDAQESDGRMVFNAFIRDVTARREAEDALRQAMKAAERANRIKTEFLANMSHELRTPLNAIIGFAEMMAHKLIGPLDDRYARYAEDIQTSGHHLLTLINDILDISRVEAGNVTMEEEVVDLFETAETCRALLQHKAASGNVAIVNQIPPDTLRLIADARRIRQILLNLIGNAIKFSPVGASVHVQLEADREGLYLRVIDQGSGISPDDLDRVFEPFVQADSNRARSHGGTGLGLTLVKRFVEMHDGTITLESRLDHGTTATVMFPARRIVSRETRNILRDAPR